MPRFGLILAAALVVAALAARPAAAQTGGTGIITGAGGGTGTSFAPEDFTIQVQHPARSNLREFELERFFNKANCDCSEPVFLKYALAPSGVAKRNSVDRNGNVDFWIGSNCGDPNLRAGRCLLLKSQQQAAFINAGNDTVETNVRIMSTDSSVSGGTINTGFLASPMGNPTCTLNRASASQGIFLLIDTNGDGYPEVTSSTSVTIDLTAPPSPDSEGISVEGGDQALVVRWPKVDSSLYTDLLGYQILCNRGGSLQVFDAGSFDPGFQRCPADVIAMGGGVDALDPLFICSPLLTASATSFRIKILQNEIVYGAAVVSIDNSGNASTPDIFYGTPIATKSFYDVYRNGHEGAVEPDGSVPGGATGGFCAVAAPVTPNRTLVVTALGLAVAGLLIAVRRRGRR